MNNIIRHVLRPVGAMVVASMFFNPTASRAFDVFPEDGEGGYVKVTSYADATVGFEFCHTLEEKTCRMLGDRKSYSYKELERKRGALKKRGFKLLAADGGVVVAGTATGIVVVLASSNPVTGTALLVAGGTGFVGGLASNFRNWMNPTDGNAFYQFKQSRTISDDVVKDRQVSVDEPIEDYAKRLDTILKSLL